MKQFAAFTLLTTMMLCAILLWENTAWRIFGAYSAAGFFACALAYALRWPRVWLKRPDGTLHPLSYVLFGPLHALHWLSLLLAIRLERAKPLHEVAPNMWLGRRLLPHELGGLLGSKDVAVLDLTSEFAENRTLRRGKYLCLPILDHTAPTVEQINEALVFLDENISQTPVFVHCALGHGRSATVVAAWLLKHGRSLNTEAAVNQLQEVRSGVRLESSQMKLLKDMFPKPVAS